MALSADPVVRPVAAAMGPAMGVLVALSFAHLLNDMMASLLPAIYPMLKQDFHLDYGQVGLITLSYQAFASMMQPLVGLYTDRYPKPYALAFGMGSTLCGLLVLSRAGSFAMVLGCTALIGVGSSVFHPEASRVARMASGGRHGFAQSLFQVGGNAGFSFGPLLAAFIVLPNGRHSIAWFALFALLGMAVLTFVGGWYSGQRRRPRPSLAVADTGLSRRRTWFVLALLFILVLSKYLYLSSINSYLTFYLIDRFAVPVRTAQLYLFAFLFSVAIGTFAGGPIGDRFGRRYVIWGSILGVLPFTLMLPTANLFWTGVLICLIGLVLASAFSAIVVYAQELVPGKVGLIAGLFFGVSFGISGIGAAAMGQLADSEGIAFVYRLCSFLPALGALAMLLPDLDRRMGPAVTPINRGGDGAG